MVQGQTANFPNCGRSKTEDHSQRSPRTAPPHRSQIGFSTSTRHRPAVDGAPWRTRDVYGSVRRRTRHAAGSLLRPRRSFGSFERVHQMTPRVDSPRLDRATCSCGQNDTHVRTACTNRPGCEADGLHRAGCHPTDAAERLNSSALSSSAQTALVKACPALIGQKLPREQKPVVRRSGSIESQESSMSNRRSTICARTAPLPGHADV